ncbi:M28 family metallopeptidase [Gammaproteobacteria bacterium AB-CW1]|uniref:M28 family metallopeptidase n=1 Tax=Natronospira elongata TaxID=3110268 RepID=A0AAP6MMY4_9GAMM|nr:M28 family metallopeptidase [Gammaproteobacteria bacterium AB-CW1]
MRTHQLPFVLTGLTLVLTTLTACDAREGDQAAADWIEKERIREHIRILASDEFQGRAPATAGGERTVEYLSREFQGMELAPGNEGTYTQTVPLLETTLDPTTDLILHHGGERWELSYGEEVMLWSGRQEETVRLEGSELVFVGFGTVAPEYDWDDYADVDVRGKTVVMLVNDPGVFTEDPDLFNGRAMTYYGRWTYKFEEAARQGAAGAILIHEDDAAGYGWDVVAGSWSGPQMSLAGEDGDQALDMEAWISRDVADRLLETVDSSLEDMTEQALAADFRPQTLPLSAEATMENRFRESESDNVIAYLPGRERPDETILFMAHWDHLGTDPDDDSIIFNGAVDNASGTAAVLEIARAFSKLEQAPRRSVAFLLVTAEEQGLLGSAHYAREPIFEPHLTVAGINLDSMNDFGPTRDITIVGYGSSELEEWLAELAEQENRELRPEPHPERGYFFRSDHFSLAKVGVPVLYPNPGIDHVEHGESYGQAQLDDYQQNRYHRPADEFDPEADYRGLLADARLMFQLALALAESDTFPNWYEDSEFRQIRDEDRQAGH